jgi:hypothetical protein
MPEIPDRKIESESELRELLKTYLPGSDAHARKTLMDGFEAIRHKKEAEASIKDIDPKDFGGYIPAPLTINAAISTLDNFIRKRMGGERKDLIIEWRIGESVLVFDPWTGDLSKK